MFDFRTISISDQEIAFVENHFGFQFNDRQKDVIRFWETTDIQACPGSGKTTTLAAKLIILANKLPRSFKQGICVITHTNVAVEEIKNKLGSYSSFFTSYPNHLGTIQSVVDRYFTIPAFKNEYKFSPRIDTDAYFEAVKRYPSGQLTNATRYLSRNRIDDIGILSFNRFNFDISIDIDTESPIVGKNTASYGELIRLKTEIEGRGLIKYDEAYSIAFRYLRENPSLRSLFSNRFPLVFIDEMQDMETHQTEILRLLLDGTTAIVQKIGDMNQSIYSHSAAEDQIEWTPSINGVLQMTVSTRIADNIACIVKPVCVNPQEMSGWANPSALRPVVIVFGDDTIHLVKDKFGELIIQNNLHGEGTFKAVGARISQAYLNINSYWEEFNRASKKVDFSTANAFLHHFNALATKTKNVKGIRNSILELVCKCLRLGKIKNLATGLYFTPFTLIKHFESLDNADHAKLINHNIADWIERIFKIEEIRIELQDYVMGLFPVFEKEPNEDVSAFFLVSETTTSHERLENQIYSYNKDGVEVKIHFDTIHGVKGETHKGTLYLETFTRLYDIGGKILKFIAGSEREQIRYRKDAAFKKRLPLAYVAMTRATHFICLAVHKDRFEGELAKYFNDSPDWDVVELSIDVPMPTVEL